MGVRLSTVEWVFERINLWPDGLLRHQRPLECGVDVQLEVDVLHIGRCARLRLGAASAAAAGRAVGGTCVGRRRRHRVAGRRLVGGRIGRVTGRLGGDAEQVRGH